MQTLTCPACPGQLYPFTFNDILLDVCQNCSGIWFDFGEMLDVSKSDTLDNIDRSFRGEFVVLSREEVRSALKRGSRTCPRCDVALDVHEWRFDTKIVIDTCADCMGTWLDKGELEGYTAFLHDVRDNPPQLPQHIWDEMEAKQKAQKEELKNYLSDNDLTAIAILGRTLKECGNLENLKRHEDN